MKWGGLGWSSQPMIRYILPYDTGKLLFQTVNSIQIYKSSWYSFMYGPLWIPSNIYNVWRKLTFFPLFCFTLRYEEIECCYPSNYGCYLSRNVEPWLVSNVWCCVLLLLVINLCKYLLKITNLLFQTVYWIRIFRFIRNSLSVFIDISAWPLSKSSSILPSILLFFFIWSYVCVERCLKWKR